MPTMQADDGYLYPLEKAFFYIHKPPTLLVYDEVESIEFMRQGAGVLSNSAKTFDLAVRMKHDQVRAAHNALECLLAACHACCNLPTAYLSNASLPCEGELGSGSHLLKLVTALSFLVLAGACVPRHPEGGVAEPLQLHQTEAAAH